MEGFSVYMFPLYLQKKPQAYSNSLKGKRVCRAALLEPEKPYFTTNFHYYLHFNQTNMKTATLNTFK
jgi:hypothetical protein